MAHSWVDRANWIFLGVNLEARKWKGAVFIDRRENNENKRHILIDFVARGNANTFTGSVVQFLGQFSDKQRQISSNSNHSSSTKLEKEEKLLKIGENSQFGWARLNKSVVFERREFD